MLRNRQKAVKRVCGFSPWSASERHNVQFFRHRMSIIGHRSIPQRFRLLEPTRRRLIVRRVAARPPSSSSRPPWRPAGAATTGAGQASLPPARASRRATTAAAAQPAANARSAATASSPSLHNAPAVPARELRRSLSDPLLRRDRTVDIESTSTCGGGTARSRRGGGASASAAAERQRHHEHPGVLEERAAAACPGSAYSLNDLLAIVDAARAQIGEAAPPPRRLREAQARSRRGESVDYVKAVLAAARSTRDGLQERAARAARKYAAAAAPAAAPAPAPSPAPSSAPSPAAAVASTAAAAAPQQQHSSRSRRHSTAQPSGAGVDITRSWPQA